MNKLNKIFRLKELPQYVGLKRTVIAEMIKEGVFPAGIKLHETGYAVGWLEQDLIDWQNARIAARKKKVA